MRKPSSVLRNPSLVGPPPQHAGRPIHKLPAVPLQPGSQLHYDRRTVSIPASMSNTNSLSLNSCFRRVSLPFRILAVGLLLFAQFSFANHYHDVAEVNTHGYDCTVCLQLHGVKNTVGPSSTPALIDHLAVSHDPRSTATDLPSFNRLLPPCRAPPLY